MKTLLTLLVFVSCKSAYVHRTDWQNVYKEENFKSTCTVNVKETIKVKGVLDGKGCTYTWIGKNKQNCHASEEISETEPRMFEMESNSTIKNMKIDCILEGIRMGDNTVIENVHFWDCGEDCISTRGTMNTIRNNKIYLAQDKAIQGNQADKVVITGNYFKHVARAFSGSGGTQGGADHIDFSNNTCDNCEIMIRSQSDHKVYAKNNSLTKGECMFESVDESRIFNNGGNKVTDATLVCKDNKNPIGE